MMIMPNQDGELMRLTKKHARGRYKGEQFDFFTVHMKMIPKTVLVNGKHRRVTGRSGGTIVYNVMSNSDKDTFNDIFDSLEAIYGDFDDDKPWTSDKPVEVDVIMSGVYYKAAFKHYAVTDDGEVDEETTYDEIRWFVPEWRNTSEDALLKSFEYQRDELIAQGRKYVGDDDLIPSDEENTNDEQEKVEKEEEKQRAGRRKGK